MGFVPLLVNIAVDMDFAAPMFHIWELVAAVQWETDSAGTPGSAAANMDTAG